MHWVALAKGGAKISTVAVNASVFFPIHALRPPGSSCKGLSGKIAISLSEKWRFEARNRR
jgi:hypothetical protein